MTELISVHRPKQHEPKLTLRAVDQTSPKPAAVFPSLTSVGTKLAASLMRQQDKINLRKF